MANKIKKTNIDLGWGDGGTELFLTPVKGGLEVLDYEFDYDRIHKMCGGRCYYRSCSGYSGAGYIEKLGDLTRVGYYRVDTVHNEWQYPEEVEYGLKIMLPYATHEECKEETLENYPVVILLGEDAVIYCNFYENMNVVLADILAGRELQGKPKKLKKKFVDTSSYYKRVDEVEIKFYNFFGYASYPWEFVGELLKDYEVDYPKEWLHRMCHLSKCDDGTLVRTCKIANRLYATEVLEKDPLENLEKEISGWGFLETNMVYKVRKNDVHIIGWKIAEEAYGKRIERMSRFIPTAEKADFTSFVKEHLPDTKYVDFEETVPKLLFFLEKEKVLTNVRKGIAKKVQEDVLSAARQYIENFNDKQILDAIPDDFIIKIEDSWDSGNCKPGTQEFVNMYFPGKTEINAGELKKYSSNWNVMRVLKYIAIREKITGKIKLELPA